MAVGGEVRRVGLEEHAVADRDQEFLLAARGAAARPEIADAGTGLREQAATATTRTTIAAARRTVMRGVTERIRRFS